MFCFKVIVDNGVTKFVRFNDIDGRSSPMFKFDWCDDDFDFVDSKGNQYNSAQINRQLFSMTAKIVILIFTMPKVFCKDRMRNR